MTDCGPNAFVWRVHQTQAIKLSGSDVHTCTQTSTKAARPSRRTSPRPKPGFPVQQPALLLPRADPSGCGCPVPIHVCSNFKTSVDFGYLLTDLRAKNGFYVFKWLGGKYYFVAFENYTEIKFQCDEIKRFGTASSPVCMSPPFLLQEPSSPRSRGC